MQRKLLRKRDAVIAMFRMLCRMARFSRTHQTESASAIVHNRRWIVLLQCVPVDCPVFQIVVQFSQFLSVLLRQCRTGCDVDRPGKPGEPECEGTTEDSITLAWEPPTKDGGKPIKGYIVEKREKGSKRWTKYATVSALYNTLAVRLSLNVTVCYRVSSLIKFYAITCSFYILFRRGVLTRKTPR